MEQSGEAGGRKQDQRRGGPGRHGVDVNLRMVRKSPNIVQWTAVFTDLGDSHRLRARASCPLLNFTRRAIRESAAHFGADSRAWLYGCVASYSDRNRKLAALKRQSVSVKNANRNSVREIDNRGVLSIHVILSVTTEADGGLASS